MTRGNGSGVRMALTPTGRSYFQHKMGSRKDFQQESPFFWGRNGDKVNFITKRLKGQSYITTDVFFKQIQKWSKSWFMSFLGAGNIFALLLFFMDKWINKTVSWINKIVITYPVRVIKNLKVAWLFMHMKHAMSNHSHGKSLLIWIKQISVGYKLPSI